MAENFEEQRKSLVDKMRLKNKAIEQAFLSIKRELFFPESMRSHAYEDTAFPIGLGQTISQPSTIAAMLEMLAVEKGNTVLEVGAGSGYVMALLSELAGSRGTVFGVELVHELHQKATRALLELGYNNFFLKCGDGTLGWKENAPFDRILISAACASVPNPLIEQLKEGGWLVAPIGASLSQELVLLQKEKGEVAEKESRCCFVFVPLKGKF
ncbi:MAG: protein-L-isoaspartate(D-aspartate) O-methyltransferase [archaeon]